MLFCFNKSCDSTMNRDENAAKNIFRLLKMQLSEQQRPRCFCRGVNIEECMEAPFGEVSVQSVHCGIITNHFCHVA